MIRYRDHSIKSELIKLNDKFHSKSLLDERFYRQLDQIGINYYQSILISIFPDGCNTYVGEIIRQDKIIVKFDIDLEEFKYSIWTDITEDFFAKYKLNQKNSCSREVIAYGLFQSLVN